MPADDVNLVAGQVLDACRVGSESGSESAVGGPPEAAAAAFSFADIDVAKVVQVIQVVLNAILPLIQQGGSVRVS